MEFLSLLLLFCITTGQTVETSSSEQYSPIILIPTITGIKLEAKWNKSVTENDCPLVSDWTTLYISESFIVENPLCFLENFRLWYDKTTRTTSNTPGVEIRALDFGNTNSVENLKDNEYMLPLVEYLVNNLSYTRGISVRAAPYDFRKAPNELGAYFDSCKDLVEETYSLNQNRKVVMFGHGSGAPMTYYFLSLQSDAWKTKYIKSFASVNGPYAGVVGVLYDITRGGPVVDDIFLKTFRDALRSMPSVAWLMPHNLYWTENDVLIRGPKRNYTVNDYRDLFDDIGFPIGFQMRKDTKNLNFMHHRRHPKVEVYCLNGIHVPTMSALFYSTWEDGPSVNWSNGDGVVNLRSLLGCGHWHGSTIKNTIYNWFPLAQHTEILANIEFLTYLSSILKIR